MVPRRLVPREPGCNGLPGRLGGAAPRASRVAGTRHARQTHASLHVNRLIFEGTSVIWVSS
jgi:hypothetical protein